MAALIGGREPAPNWISWHSQADAELRGTIIRQVYSLFAKRKPVLHDQGKLPDFIKRLEEALYKCAKSREEYADLTTLEARLLEVVRRVMQKPNGHKPSNADQLLAALNQQAAGATPDMFAQQQAAAAAQQQQQQQAGGVQQLMVPMQPAQQAQQAGMLPQQQAGLLPQPPGGGGAAGLQPPGAQGLMMGSLQPPGAGGMLMVPMQQQQQQPGQPPGNGPLFMNGGLAGPAGQMAAPGMNTADSIPRPPSAADGAANTPNSNAAAAAAGAAPAQQPGPFSAMLLGSMGSGPSAMMSNGAPVLMRSGGGGAGSMVPVSVPLQPGVLNGMVPAQLGGGMQLNALLGSQQPPALIKPEGGVVPAGGMVPMSATGGGLDGGGLAAAQQQQQQQQAFGSLGGLGMQAMPGPGLMIPINASDQSAQTQGLPTATLHALPQAAGGAAPAQLAALQQRQPPQPAQQPFLMPPPQQQPPGAAGLDLSGLPLGLGGVKQEPPGLKAEPSDAQGGDNGPSYSLDAILGGPVGDGAQVATSNPEGGSALPHEQRKQQILKQQRWLLFLRHCAKCPAGVDGEAQCQYGQTCTVAKQLWKHLIGCKDQYCTYPRCAPSRALLRHHQKCTSAQCPVCTPVKQYVSKQRALVMSRKAASLPPEQRQLYLQQLQQMGASHPELLQLMGGGGKGGAGGGGGDGGFGVHPSLAAVMGNAGAAPVLDAQPAKRARTILQENMGTSLIEYFNRQQILLHLEKLKASPQPTKPTKQVFTLDTLPDFEDENSCKVCGLNRLTFEPPSLYCFSCGQRIKRNQTFYCTPVGHEIKGNWCHTCYTDIKADRVELDGFVVRKAELEKRKNDDEVEEGWVQCDRCECWVHQICGLFNKGRNDQDRGYLCPQCLLYGLESGERKLPVERPQAMLSAKDLPRCDLSDHLEARLERALQEERRQRAAALGLLPEQVPTAEGLTVRVVNNVVKKNEVKLRFHEAFKNDGYAEAFLYKQKVILLFQNIDGVDLCLYCLYMQEYGEDVAAPNRKQLYLSYLDSVKYFQPEDMQAAGRNCALRTLVYHDLLVGYLEYMKQRGFLSMYIWACPPLQGDDYILYCHPGKQKTPRSDRLREWYHTMLRQAKAEGIVTHVSNLFDTFFDGGKEHRLEKPSITQLPYFEGDYWPGEAENLLANLGEEQRQAGKNSSKGNKGRTKGGSKGKRFGAGAGSTDEQLLGRLGEVIQGMKDDFIVVHLQEPCSFCREYVSGDIRHAHPNPPQKVVIKAERSFDGIVLDRPGGEASRTISLQKFQLCPGCFARESGATPAKPRGLPTGISLSDLRPLACDAIPAASDTVPELENEFFDSRQAFLSLCQGNHYQFDTLRRAKHSSMMVLYHLHNPTAPAFSCTCNVCNMEIEMGAGFRCTVCSDFDMCARCKAAGLVQHPHPLTQHVRKIDEQHQRLTERERQERSQQLQRTMWLLVHASACSDTHCPSSNCAKVKALFNHAMTCRVKIGGGCAYCRRMWALLQAHAKMCTASDCPVPRCRELRELRRHQAARQEEKRRAAYRAMLRAQAGGSGAGLAVGAS